MEALLKSFLNKYRPQIGIFLVVAVVTAAGVWALTTGRSKPSEIEKISGTTASPSEPGEATASSTSSSVTTIKVDVSGATVNPGVYELSEGGRVEDALDAAGGLSDEADREWVAKNLNLAAKLFDGDKLYIPKVGETEPAAVAPIPQNVAGVVSEVETSPGGESSNCSRVNINKASAATLADCLSGIGQSGPEGGRAQSIINYREAHGGFKSIEEIQEVSGIGPKTFEKIKDQITVN